MTLDEKLNELREKEKESPVYISTPLFLSLLDCIETLERVSKGTPGLINRHFEPGFSGGATETDLAREALSRLKEALK